MDETQYPITYAENIWTYQDYLSLPEDGKQYQLIRGVLYMVPAPTSYHQKISRKLLLILGNFVEENNLGEIFYSPIDVIFSNAEVVQPDILFVAKDRQGLIKEKGIFGAPDLIIEIISPSTRRMDEDVKKPLYEKQGVYEYLLVYPEEKKALHYVLEGGFYKTIGTYSYRDTVPLKTLELKMELPKIF